MLADDRIEEIGSLRSLLYTSHVKSLDPVANAAMDAIDELLTEREELLAELAKPCYMRVANRQKRPDLVFPPEYYDKEGAHDAD